MYKGLASKVQLMVWDVATGGPKTGDAANLTPYLKKDNGALSGLTSSSATEVSATNAPGLYEFNVSAAEATADDLIFTGKSATSGVYVVPLRITTVDLINFGIVGKGTAQAATGTTLQVAASETFSDNAGIGFVALIYTTAQGFQARGATLNVGSTDTFTVDAWAVAPTGAISYWIFGTAPQSSTGVAVLASSVRSALGLSAANLDTQLTGISDKAANLQTRTVAALVNGNVRADLRSLNGVDLVGTGATGDNVRPTGIAIG